MVFNKLQHHLRVLEQRWQWSGVGGGILPLMTPHIQSVFRSSFLTWSQIQNKLSFRIQWTVVVVVVFFFAFTPQKPDDHYLLFDIHACSFHSFCWFLVSYSATSYSDSRDFLFFFPSITYYSSIDFCFLRSVDDYPLLIFNIKPVRLDNRNALIARLLLHGRVVNPIIRFLPDTISQAFPYSGFRGPDLCFSFLLKSVTSMQRRGLSIVLTGVKRCFEHWTKSASVLKICIAKPQFCVSGHYLQYDRDTFFLIICCEKTANTIPQARR